MSYDYCTFLNQCQVCFSSVPYVELNGQVLPNNSLVVVSDIVADAARTLRCVTPRIDCCSDADTAVAQWYHPDGRGAGAIQLLNRLSSGEGEPLGSVALVRAKPGLLGSNNEGIYRCTVPNPGTAANLPTVSYYIGIYNNRNGEGMQFTSHVMCILDPSPFCQVNCSASLMLSSLLWCPALQCSSL